MQANRVLRRWRVLVAGLFVGGLAATPASAEVQRLNFEAIGRTAAAGPSRAGGVAYYAPTKTLYVANRAQRRIDTFDLSDPSHPQPTAPIEIDLPGASSDLPTAVAASTACGGLVAVTVPAIGRTAPGSVAVYGLDGTPKYRNPSGSQRVFPTGAGPKHLAFMRGRHTLVVASEAPPSNTGADAPGQITRIHWKDCTPLAEDISRGPLDAPLPIDAEVRRFPAPAAGTDLEPEFVSSDPTGRYAYVSLQENNAVAIIDVATGRWQAIRSVGFSDHSSPGSGLDVSDRDGEPWVRPWPHVHGMRQPSAIATYEIGGKTYVVTANQGAPRNYAFQTEEHRVNGLQLDRTSFPDYRLSRDTYLGRLNVSTQLGDTDGDGDFDELYAFGGRSISILDAGARPIWDSGEAIERWTAQNERDLFNIGSAAGSLMDDRSSDRGPEPKAITTGLVGGRRYAFLANAQQGSLFGWDLSDVPGRAAIAGQINSRPTDLGADAITFIPRYESPNGRDLVVVTYARTGTTAIYGVRLRRTMQFSIGGPVHASDLPDGLDPSVARWCADGCYQLIRDGIGVPFYTYELAWAQGLVSVLREHDPQTVAEFNAFIASLAGNQNWLKTGGLYLSD